MSNAFWNELKGLINKRVIVYFKNNNSCEGKLVSIDNSSLLVISKGHEYNYIAISEFEGYEKKLW